MKTNLREGIFDLTKCFLFFFIILIQSCTSTSGIRLEGNDFKENLPGFWIGNWKFPHITETGRVRVDIIKIDGNKVHLDAWAEKGGSLPDSDDVYGLIENSTLFVIWPAVGCKDEYKMIRDDSNNLILDGHMKCENISGKVQLKKIDWK